MKQSQGTPFEPGDALPEFTLLPFHGARPITWQPGRVTALSFCALWCDTWREQSARLRAVRRNLEGLPITYLTISVDGRWAERFADAGAASEVLLDEGGRLSARLGVRAVPWTFVVDRTGTVQMTQQGIVRGEELEETLRRLATGDRGERQDQTVYLTFDDFPAIGDDGDISPDEALLDILRTASVPATFFCIGEHLTTRAGAAIARRAAREGHALQMHGWSHDAGAPDLGRCARIIRDVTGAAPTLYRPPGSSLLLRADGRTPAAPRRPVVNPYDYLRPGRAELSRRILSATRPGAILQLHAGVAETRDILPDLIRSLRRRYLGFACPN
jgi:peptidoglycan/xylan/chitin deacetylase (PgdA/CDA1 family)